MSDWAVLGLEGDPCPGDPGRTRELAGRLRGAAELAEHNTTRLRGVAAGGGDLRMQGDYAPKFLEVLGELPDQLAKLGTAFRGAEQALSGFASGLEAAKTQAGTALRQGRDADAQYQGALRQIQALLPPDRASTVVSRRRVDESLLETVIADQDEGTKVEVRAAARRARFATEDRDRAARLAADAARLRGDAATRCVQGTNTALNDSGIKNKSWFQKAWDTVSAPFRSWDAFVELCGNIAMVAGIAAMFISGPIGWALMAAALVAGAVMMGDTLTKFAQGKAGLGDLAFAALGLIPGARGAVSLAKLGRGAAGLARGIGAGGGRAVVAALRTGASRTGQSIRSGITTVWDKAVAFTTRTCKADPVDVADQGGLSGADQGGDLLLVRYRYDQARRLTEVINSAGLPWRFDYDPDGRMTRWTDRNGTSYDYAYDEAGRCVRTAGTAGYLNSTFTYHHTDPGHTVTEVSDSLGHITRFELNEAGQVVREVNALGQATTSEWDRYDRLLARTDPLGRTTRYTYDNAGNLTVVTRPDGSQAIVEYNQLRLPTTIIDPDTAIRRCTYDQQDNLTTSTDPLGAGTTYGYDQRGHLTTVTDALQHTHRVQTDDAGLPIAVTDPLGATTGYTRDTFGRVSAVTDPLGGATSFGWTVEGKLAARTLPDGATERWAYDGEGNLVEYVDALGQSTSTEIGHFDLPAARTTPDGARLQFSYDTELRLTSVTNPQGLTWRYHYDPAGNLTSETDFNNRTLSYAYDAAGQLTRRTDGAGQTTHYLRDLLGNIIEQRCDDTVTTFGYNAAGLIVRAIKSRLLQRRSYTYRADGYPTSMDDHPSGMRRFDLDPVGRVTTVRGSDWAEHYAYDPAGNITHATWPVPPQADAGAQGRREYTGTLIRRAGNIRYHYDAQGRITQHQHKTPSAKPRTWHYTWNTDDQLSTVTTPDGQHWRYRYDPLGRRIAKQRLTADGTTVLEQVDFTWDGTTLAEQTHTSHPESPSGESSATDRHTTTWDWEPDTFRPITQIERTPLPVIAFELGDASQEWVDQQFYAIITDLIGTPTELVDEQGRIAWHLRATLWGTAHPSGPGDANCLLRFPGQYHDHETGLHYSYFRYYDPATARYDATDPLGLVAGPNPHTYVPNPTHWTDPFGLTPGSCTENASRHVGPATPAGRLTASQQRDMAKFVGLKPHPGRSHGQPVFTDGKRFYSYDVDGHNGGLFKVARDVKSLGSKATREGTLGLGRKAGSDDPWELYPVGP